MSEFRRDRTDMNQREARLVLIVAFVLALATIIGRALIEVLRGNGAKAYENFYGMQIHWVTVLTVTASVLVAFIVAMVLRWWRLRVDRAIDRLTLRRTKGNGETTDEAR